MATEPRCPAKGDRRPQQRVDEAVKQYLEQRPEADPLPTFERELPLRPEQTGDSRLLGGGFEKGLKNNN